jgi:DNA polymerase III subunit beta
MKLICTQSTFSSNLSLVSRAVSSRPSHPVLANVLLDADAQTQQIRLSAFDLSLGIETSFPAEVSVGGKLALPAKLLNDIVSRMPEGDITLDDGTQEASSKKAAAQKSDTEALADVPDAQSAPSVSGAPIVLTIVSAVSGRYQVRGMGAEDFPELPVVEDGEETHLPVNALIEGLHGSVFAASTDETKQLLTGVHLSRQAQGLEFAATDGHRLAVVETVQAEEGESVNDAAALNVTIPAKALQELTKMLDRQTAGDVTVQFDQSQAVFQWTDQRLTSRLLEGQYPNYRQLLPKDFTRQVTVERRLLLSALERIAVLADQKNNIVKLSINAGGQEIALSVEAQDVGSGREVVPAQISGDDLDVAFNVRYLMDGLKVITTTEVQMQLKTATSPTVLSPVGGMRLTYLVMPVQIRG